MKDLTKILLGISAVFAAAAQVPAVQAMVAMIVVKYPGAAAAGALLTFVGGLLYHPAAPAKP